MSSARPVDAVRFGLGAAALLRPDLFGRLDGHADSVGVRRAVRVLGGRYVAQSMGALLGNRRWIPEIDAGVDLIHAASMVGLAALTPAHRRLALISAAAATTFALIDLREPVR